MALSRCLKCGTRFAIGAPHCPQCTSTRCEMEAEDMSPKTTVHGGPSNVDGENGWDGNSSSASTEPPTSTDSNSSSSGQSPAPTTEPPSSPDLTGSSSADSTGGETADPYDGKTKAELQDELVARELPKSGTIPELIERLRANDAELEAADEYDESVDPEAGE